MQLSESQVDIRGVVNEPGAGGWDNDDSTKTLFLTFAAWRIGVGPIETIPVAVACKLTKNQLGKYFRRVRSFEIWHVIASHPTRMGTKLKCDADTIVGLVSNDSGLEKERYRYERTSKEADCGPRRFHVRRAAREIHRHGELVGTRPICEVARPATGTIFRKSGNSSRPRRGPMFHRGTAVLAR